MKAFLKEAVVVLLIFISWFLWWNVGFNAGSAVALCAIDIVKVGEAYVPDTRVCEEADRSLNLPFGRARQQLPEWMK